LSKLAIMLTHLQQVYLRFVDLKLKGVNLAGTPDVCSGRGAIQKSGGTVKKICLVLCTRICAPNLTLLAAPLLIIKLSYYCRVKLANLGQ